MALIFDFFSGKILSWCESWKNASCDGLMLKAWYEEKAWREYLEAELVRTLSISLESVQLRRSHFIFIGFESTENQSFWYSDWCEKGVTCGPYQSQAAKNDALCIKEVGFMTLKCFFFFYFAISPIFTPHEKY